ncbi:LysM peptidoglycan-binding domain-containing protein [Nitratifractor sp.]
MKPLSEAGASRLLLTVLLLVGNLEAADRLPGSDCRDRENLRLLKRCDPYAVHFIKVNLRDLEPSPRAFGRLGKYKPDRSPLRSGRRLSLGHLVERFIDYEERILRVRHKVASERISRIPRRYRKLQETTIVSQTQEPSRSESNGSKSLSGVGTVTLAEYFGSRDPSRLVMKLQRRTLSYPSKTEEIKAAPPPKASGPIVHIVGPGESFSALARIYRTTVYDIRRWNRLKKDHLLKVGEKLTIHPGVRTPAKQIREALRREKFGYYKVRKGDSLIAVARRFDVKVREIRSLNDLKKISHLRIGQKLMLPLEQKKIDEVLKKERRFKYASDKRFRHKLRVTATAYTSHRGQTDRTPFIAAWNNRIRPGMKIIAVSPDLIRRYGITNGTKVKISGLPGIYVVRDKMHPKWRRKIDIYMGTNRRKALRWGRRSVILYW